MEETDERTKLQIDCQQLLAFTQCAYTPGEVLIHQDISEKYLSQKNVHSAIIHTLIIFFIFLL